MPLSIKTGAVKVKDSDGDYVDIDLTLSDGYAPLESPAFTGTPTAPTPGVSDDSTKVATTAFVQDVVDSLDAGDIEYSSGATYSNGSTGKAISDLNGSVSNLNGAINSSDSSLAIRIQGNTNNTGATIDPAMFIVLKGHSSLPDGAYITAAQIANGNSITSSNVTSVPNGIGNYLKFHRVTASSNQSLTSVIQSTFDSGGQVFGMLSFNCTGSVFSDFPSGAGTYGAGYAVMAGYHHTVYYRTTAGVIYTGIKTYLATSWTWESSDVTNTIEHAIGVVVDGDTASPNGVSAGSYVYVKNNTHGLADGMYIAKTAFPTSGGTANSSVFEAAPYGAMNSATSNKVGVPNTTYINSDSYSVSRRFGRIAVAVGSNIKPSQNITGTTAFISGLDPAYAVTYFPMISTDGTSVARAYINTTGEIHIFWSTMATGKEYYFNASYITQF